MHYIREKKVNIKFSFEPIVSIDFHNLKRLNNNIDYFFDEDRSEYIIPEEFAILPDKFALKSTNFDYSIGIVGSLSLPSWNENLALNLQVKYGRYKLSGEEKLTSGKIGTFSTEGKNMMNSLYLSYTFPRGMFRPIFLAGFSYSYFTSINDLHIIEHGSVYSNSNEYIMFNEYDPDVIEKNYIGIVAGAGLDIPIFKKNKISTTIQYNLMVDFGYSYSYNPLSIIVGFKF